LHGGRGRDVQDMRIDKAGFKAATRDRLHSWPKKCCLRKSTTS
jgi:hypothetical protein